MLSVVAVPPAVTSRWSVEQAHEWASHQRWSTGCNFIPSKAINQIEMWQSDTFDPVTLDRELGWMHATGMSLARVFLHDLAYEEDKAGFKHRINTFLDLTDKHQIKVMFVFFDDCWDPHPKIGKQRDPKPGVHNSGWVQSPATDKRTWPKDLGRLKTYVQDVLRTYKNDKRVYMWDLYNEPGNSGYAEKSEFLVKKVFEWAQQVRPSQPLTVGAWGMGAGLDKVCVDLSDVTTFHCYDDVDRLREQIAYYKGFGRPVVCTEWMARSNSSLIRTHLPVFKEEGVSCLQWGFVSGKTNTIYPWGSKEGGPEPNPWFHDLLHRDGTPYDPKEVELYRELSVSEVGSQR